MMKYEGLLKDIHTKFQSGPMDHWATKKDATFEF